MISMLQKLLIHSVILLVVFTPNQVSAQGRYDGPKSTKDLQIAIEKILNESGTPAAGVALVSGDSVIWATAIGMANVEKKIKANENTMFRIGSVSKMFVSLAILKLQQEGLIKLKDKVRDLAPDVEFINRWEKTNPILVEHLLEHTTGWDDLHAADYALSDPKLTLKQGLDFLPVSRTSRWVPGTRMAYCNSGPAVAAYIIEKITGQTYEAYIEKNFFLPMGMENMTFFASEPYKKLGATLYLDKKPQPYWNISVRPSGSINASPKDMAKMIKFFINRGRIDTLQLISEASLNRMETPESTTGARAGMQNGYGLGNYSTSHKSYVYRSHGGGVNGGLTDFSYLPSHEVGYVVMVNSGDQHTLGQISYLIREYQTKHFNSDKVFRNQSKAITDPVINGYYIQINPRIQMMYYVERIINVKQLWSKDEFLFISNLFGGWTETYSKLNDKQYVSKENGTIGVVRVEDPLEGNVIHADSRVLARISPIVVYGQLILVGLWLLYICGSLCFGLYWIIRYFINKKFPKRSFNIGLWPCLTSLFAVMVYILGIIGSNDFFESLGKVSVISVSIMLATLAFALSSLMSVINIILLRNTTVNQIHYWHLAVLSGLHLLATFYLMWYGMIGIRLWS